MTLNEIGTAHHLPHVLPRQPCLPAISSPGDQVCLVERRRWRDLPLCQRYFYAVFGTLPIQTDQQTVASNVLVWARGYVADGGSELLGLWQMREAGAREWRELGEDLRSRGLVDIAFGLTDTFGFSQCDLASVHDSAVAISWASRLRRCSAQESQNGSSGLVAVSHAITSSNATRDATADLDAHQGGRPGSTYQDLAESSQTALSDLESSYGLAPRFCRLMRTAEIEAELLHKRLVRSVARHGAFADGEAALAFVGRLLERAQRGFDARGVSLGSFVASNRSAETKVPRTRRQHPHPADPMR